MKKILFIGGVNSGNSPKGGEEYKNQLFVSRLSDEFWTEVIDTFNWSKKPALILRLFWNLFFVDFDRIVISASSGSTYKLLRVLNLFPFRMKRTFYFVIGGYFPEGLRSKIFNIKYYRRLRGIVVEGEKLKQEILSVSSLINVNVVPNFKIFELVDKSFINHFKSQRIKFVFVSRISKSKGIDTIFGAVRILNKQGFENSFSVDFFGKIEKEYILEFESGINLSNCSYQGYLDLMNKSSESYQLLSNYHVMLFPTYWKGEGFPGAIIDAYVAGLPVIASDWNMNKDIVINGQSGMLLAINDSETLANAMRHVLNNKLRWAVMAQTSSKQALTFHLDTVWPTIKELLLTE